MSTNASREDALTMFGFMDGQTTREDGASRASVASICRYWSMESFDQLDGEAIVALRFCLERAADLLGEPATWGDVAEEALGVMKVVTDVAAKKAADDIYAHLLDTSMDYLEQNLRFNIASAIETAERGRKEAQDRVAGLSAQADALRCLLTDEKAARLDMSLLAAEEADKADILRGLLTRAREYLVDALEAYEHSDGRDLLKEIDAALPSKPLRIPIELDEAQAPQPSRIIEPVTPDTVFRAGDRVRRASDSPEGTLRAGEWYEVRKLDDWGDLILTRDARDDLVGWFRSRFDLIERAPQ